MLNLNFLKVGSKFTKKLLPILIIVLFIAVAGYFSYDYYKTQQELSQYKQDTTVGAIKAKNELLKEVGKLAVLPADEEPTIATVSDAFRLRGQKFFAQAENGDKVIIYANAERAILYRPSVGKVIESAPINIQDFQNTVSRNEKETPEATASSSETPLTKQEAPASVAVYNGTLYVEGLANRVGAYLVKEMPGNRISIDILDNANKINEDTLIIDLTGEYPEIASEFADILDGEVVDAPEDVNYPEVDIIVIAGKDLEDRNLQ
jgi:hypothetical protein